LQKTLGRHLEAKHFGGENALIKSGTDSEAPALHGPKAQVDLSNEGRTYAYIADFPYPRLTAAAAAVCMRASYRFTQFISSVHACCRY